MPADDLEAVSESAKAVQEAAKFGGKAIDAVREAGGDGSVGFSAKV